MSTTPCYPDQTNTYGQLDGEITSEFADYVSSVDRISRNCSAAMNFTQNDQITSDGVTGTALIQVTLSEPLMISPLVFSDISSIIPILMPPKLQLMRHKYFLSNINGQRTTD
jgi:hypothetical protein